MYNSRTFAYTTMQPHFAARLIWFNFADIQIKVREEKGEGRKTMRAKSQYPKSNFYLSLTSDCWAKVKAGGCRWVLLLRWWRV